MGVVGFCRFCFGIFLLALLRMEQTDYFGPITRQAVQDFQMKHGIAEFGDDGFGEVGPRTRSALQDAGE